MKQWLSIAAVTALLIVIAVAASVQGTARFDPPEFDRPQQAPEPAPTSAPQTLMPWLPDDAGSNDTAGQVVLIVLIVVAAAIVALLVFLLVRAILRAWRARIPRREAERPSGETFALDGDADPEIAAPTIRRGIESALRVIDDHPDPSDAIVAAWAGLEETVAATGTARGVSETPAEFAARIVARPAHKAAPPAHEVAIVDDAQVLLRLYERVRFAGHAATAEDRAAARRALAALEERWR